MDVERIREALANTIVEADGVVHQSKHRGDQAAIAGAARLVVEGKSGWFCEPHDQWSWNPDNCWVQDMGPVPCDMTQGRLLVPPKGET